jgi:DHA1 family multidrug resistance protein-like MFS transporter
MSSAPKPGSLPLSNSDPEPPSIDHDRPEHEVAPIPWRRNLNAIFAGQLLVIIAFSLRAPFLPFYLGDLGLDDVDDQALWAGYVNAAGFGAMAITAPLWGMVADKHGRKPMLLRAQLAAFCTLGLMGLATEPWHLLALRAIEGGLTGTVVAATALVASTTPAARLGYGLGLIQTAVFSGSAIGPLFGGLIADNWGYRPAFGIGSAMMLSGACITLFIVQERFRPQAKGALDQQKERVWRLLLAPALVSLALAMLVIRFASIAIQPIIPLFVEELSNATEHTSSLAGITLGVLGVTSAISSIFFGRLGDKFGYRRILVASTLGSGLIYIPMALTQHPWQLIVLQAMFGVFAGGMVPAANALVAMETAPERRGVVFGLMAAATAVGGFLGPLAGSGFAALFGFRLTFAAVGIVLLILFAWLAWQWRGAPKPVPAI